MTLKAMLAEIREGQEDLKAIERLQDTCDTRRARKRAQARFSALAETLNQKNFTFQAPEEPESEPTE